MFEFKAKLNPASQIESIQTHLRGHALLGSPKLNKGCAFSHEERIAFHLEGLLPAQIETLEQQTKRMYAQYQEHMTNLGKHIYLNVLHDYNETLFYKVVSEHLEEMLPIIYTPTVGDAVQRFSLELRKPKGLYIAYEDMAKIDELLDNRLPQDVDVTVITDGEAVLGIGDQGIGGINISSAKLMVYTLCGGINPNRVLPIQLDVGTNNPHLLNDPMYLGWRHERITGQAYDDFIDCFVKAIRRKFPNIYLHWEDFGRDNARRILARYSDQTCTINGDMQATGVVAMAAILAAIEASDRPLAEQRIAIFGAGTAGVGIADQIMNALTRAGLSEQAARDRFYLIDRQGLLTTDMKLLSFQGPYAKSRDALAAWPCRVGPINLLDVVTHAKPTILIGCSTVAGAFNERIIKQMMQNCARPIIMPLSNPTTLAEAKPQELFTWTNGEALVATGSPFSDVEHAQRLYRVAQCNNALAFPGIGLGVIASQAARLTDDMLWAATVALSECSPLKQDKSAALLPKIAESRIISRYVALAVANEARRSGLARVKEDVDLKKVIDSLIYEPRYYPYEWVQSL